MREALVLIWYKALWTALVVTVLLGVLTIGVQRIEGSIPKCGVQAGAGSECVVSINTDHR